MLHVGQSSCRCTFYDLSIASLGPCIEFEKFWPLSPKAFQGEAFGLKCLCSVLVSFMLKKCLKALKTR